MTGPEVHLAARIRSAGPLTIAEFMTECLVHPEFGYYATRDPFGAGGDFTTAPEISQMFGELVGLSLAQCWLDQGAPAPVVLAEAGPGRGTMMADILRATRLVPGFHEALDVHLVETSTTLREVQRETLTGYHVTWHDGVETLPPQPLLLVANEFFDALPIRQLQRDGEMWRERLVGLTDGALAFELSDPKPVKQLQHRLDDTETGDLVEICLAGQMIAAAIGAHIEDHGGAALIIDYGDWRSLGDTLQAVRAHEPVDPLTCPGDVDLTAHVDFEALAEATPSSHSRLTPQGVFLERLGITARAQALAATLAGATLNSHVAAHRRLTHPDEMGTLFKVIGFFPCGAAPPPGLDL